MPQYSKYSQFGWVHNTVNVPAYTTTFNSLPRNDSGVTTMEAWTAFRKVVPLLATLEGVPSQSRPMAAAAFVVSMPAGNFYSGAEPMPGSAENPSK